MLIIPAATARQLVRSPELMALTASFLGAISVFAGIFASIKLDTPSGPSIVAASALLFVTLFPIATLLSKRR